MNKLWKWSKIKIHFWVAVPDLGADMKQWIIFIQLFLSRLFYACFLNTHRSEYSFLYFNFKLPKEKSFQLVNFFFIYYLQKRTGMPQHTCGTQRTT